MTQEIKNAFEHINLFYPEVEIAIFTKDGRWLYMDDNFNTPTFGSEIDTSILEDAIDSIEELPAIFQI